MIDDRNLTLNKKPLPPQVIFKYGEKERKMYRLATIRIEDFTYNNLLTLIKASKPVKAGNTVCITFCKAGLKDGLTIKNEKQFTNFIQSGELHTFLDKSNLKVEFHHVKAEDTQNTSKIDKGDIVNDINSK